MPTIFEQLPDAIGDEHRETFDDQGYVAFETFLTTEQLRQARAALSQVVRKLHADAVDEDPAIHFKPSDEKAANYAGARISREDSKCSLLFEHGRDPLAATPDEAERMLRNIYFFENEHPFYRDLVDHPITNGTVAQLLGEDAILFQVMALSKSAHFGSEKPWHQDNAYFSFAPLDKIVGVWIALDDATPENGCMHVLPGAHRSGARKHVHTFDCQIESDAIDPNDAVPVPLPAGGAMFFYGMLPHQTPPNRTDHRRRALQFHYRGESTYQLDPEDYANDVFVDSQGRASSCAVAKNIVRARETNQPA